MYAEQVTLRGTSESVDAVALVADVRVKDEEPASVTAYEVMVGGSWRFAIAGVQGIVSGTC